MKFKGKIFRFGDDINTDWIISGRYKFAINDMRELCKYIFEDIRPNFYKEIIPHKSIIVAGSNFGMGSSREQAPWVIKESGILCVIARSFARIFYRNAFNIGLPLIEADTDSFKENDTLDVDINKGEIRNNRGNKVVEFFPFDRFREDLIRLGGIINYLGKYGDFKI